MKGRWGRIAADLVPGVVPRSVREHTARRTKARNLFLLRAFHDSRGGTRTRDPGIMSAVL